jgi:signal peptidase I
LKVQVCNRNFDTGQFLIVSRLSYLLGEPDYGDIIVFHYFNNPEDDYIKRVIGLPGDTVKMQNLAVYVNGKLIQEPYINEPCSDSRCRDNEWVLGEDEFFVMGDNRNHSSDSRGVRFPSRANTL